MFIGVSSAAYRSRAVAEAGGCLQMEVAQPTAAELSLRQEDTVLLLLKWPSPEFCSMCTLGRQGTSPSTVVVN